MQTVREMMFTDTSTPTTYMDDAANFIVHPEEGSNRFLAARMILFAVIFFATIGLAYLAASKHLDISIANYATANNLEIYKPTNWVEDDL